MPGPRAAREGSAPRPVYVVWELTLACDHACGHCGSRAGKARPRELDRDECLSVVRALAELGAVEVTLIGGEAYLAPHWADVARAIAGAGMRCTMTTGGRGLDAKVARAAKDAGVSAVSVSIDGLRAAHDRQRGMIGSFDAALRALDALADAGVDRAGNTQLNRLSLPDLDGVLELLARRGAAGWQVQLTVPMGRAAERPEWLLQPYELPALYDRLAALARAGAASGVRLWPANNVGYFGPHEALLRNRGDEEGERRWHGCPAGTYALGVESDGTIKGCPSLPTRAWSGGDVRARSLAEIWREAPALSAVRARTVDDLWGYCRGCYYAAECMAGCTWTSHVFFGRPGNNPYCHHRALEHAARGERERLVRVAPPPGEPFDHGRFEIVVESL